MSLLSLWFDFELYLFELCLANFSYSLWLFVLFYLELYSVAFYFEDGRRLVNKVALQQSLKSLQRQPIQTWIDLGLLLFLVGLHIGENAFHHQLHAHILLCGCCLWFRDFDRFTAFNFNPSSNEDSLSLPWFFYCVPVVLECSLLLRKSQLLDRFEVCN